MNTPLLSLTEFFFKSRSLPFILLKVTFLDALEETGMFLCLAHFQAPHYTDPILQCKSPLYNILHGSEGSRRRKGGEG